MPTYNEDPHRITARLRAMWESVEQSGQHSRFDWFVLSDSTDPSVWIAEEKCYLQLRCELAVEQQVVDAQPRVLLPMLAEVIPEREDRLARMLFA